MRKSDVMDLLLVPIAERAAARVASRSSTHSKDELLAAAWLGVMKAQERFREDLGRLEAFAYTLAYQSIVDQLREEGRQVRLLGGDADPFLVEDPRTPEEPQLRATMSEILSGADVDGATDRMVAHLRWVDGMSCREVAHELGLTEDAVKSRCSRIRSRVRAQEEKVG